VSAPTAIGIAMMLGLKWSILASHPRATFPAIVIGAHVVSRWCAISLIWRLRYVRTDTEGKSKAFADTVGAADWWLSGALGALALLPVILLVDSCGGTPIGLALLAALALSAASTLLAGAYFRIE